MIILRTEVHDQPLVHVFYFSVGNWSEPCGYELNIKVWPLTSFYMKGIISWYTKCSPCAYTWKTSLFSSMKLGSVHFSNLELLNFEVLKINPVFFSIFFSSCFLCHLFLKQVTCCLFLVFTSSGTVWTPRCFSKILDPF